MSFQFLTTRREGAIEYLTLNRPDVRNALNPQMIAELADWASALSAPGDRHDVRAVVLAGAGTVFCAGADAKWMSGTVSCTESDNLRDAKATAEMFAALDTLPVPLICRIQGAALGGGAGLAAVGDIVIAEDRATFAFPEVKLGIVPAMISPFVLAKIGQAAARELFLTGARFPALRAKEIGLVHAVVPADELDTRVAEYVREILTSAPGAVAAAKALIRDVRWRAPGDAAKTTAGVIAKLRVSEEGQEGLRAFLEKRTPSWSPVFSATKNTKNTKDKKNKR
jgi:methylglutaconyl-CoA hydratase